ncbi:MAG TPA: hypothetical protein VN026_19055 [Bacteroidia bacterium]|jgi:hypothetical protein|nr:hypothetical protein [Bacteroidia bacterium]
MKRCACLIISFLYLRNLSGQELFPLNEPASNVPKNAIGLRLFNQSYGEGKTIRGLDALRVMYGVLPRLTIMATASMSNHHGSDFPANLATHTHNGTQTVYSTGGYVVGIPYPYRFNGISFYAKYRFVSVDGQNKHFRMAAYGGYSYLNVAHDEAEPNLLDDTKGYGGGLITTYLKNKFAVSLTSGVIIPQNHKGSIPDPAGTGPVPTEVKYGRAVEYNLSFGYLVFPRKYENYNQTNWSLYLEFMGKTYEKAKITQFGFKDIPVSTPLLQQGNYIDVCPGIQAIIRSNLRIDLSVKFPMINKSYAHFYPVYSIAIQRYFFTKK